MNSKRILISLVLALVVSVLCTWLVSRKLTVPPTVKKQPDARYATPSRALHAGEILKSNDIELVAWPSSDPEVPCCFDIGCANDHRLMRA